MMQMADLEGQRDLKTGIISETCGVTVREHQAFEDFMSTLYQLHYSQVIETS
jgi:hypothetical protein